MNDWTTLDDQMRPFAPYLRDELKFTLPESNALASSLSEEIRSLSQEDISPLLCTDYVLPSDRLDELMAFQSFMDIANANPGHPGLTRSQVISQNYISFVYLGDACFKILKKCSPTGSVTKRCCRFLTDNPVRAFRNAVAHANWKYKSDYSGLIFWARKGSDPNEPMAKYEVAQQDLGFWQALSRCVAYVTYTTITDKKT